MEKIFDNGFSEMNNEELRTIDGGFAWVVFGLVIAYTVTQTSSCSNKKK